MKKLLLLAIFLLPFNAHALTFGYTTTGASTVTIENTIRCESGVTTVAGDVIQISAQVASVTTADKEMSWAIYAYTSSSDAGALLAQATSQTVLVGTTPLEVVGPASLAVTATTNYFVCAWGESAVGVFTISDDTGGASEFGNRALTYTVGAPAWPNPMASESTDTLLYTIFATYNASTPAVTKKQSIIWFTTQ